MPSAARRSSRARTNPSTPPGEAPVGFSNWRRPLGSAVRRVRPDRVRLRGWSGVRPSWSPGRLDVGAHPICRVFRIGCWRFFVSPHRGTCGRSGGNPPPGLSTAVHNTESGWKAVTSGSM
jgi:hypothetical protein